MSAFAAPPVRFLVAVMALWTGARATALMWEEGVVDPARRGTTELVALDPPKVPAIIAEPKPTVQLAMAEPVAPAAIVPAVLTKPAPTAETPVEVAPAEQGSVDPEALLLIASYGGPPQLPMPEPAPVVLALNTIALPLSEA